MEMTEEKAREIVFKVEDNWRPASDASGIAREAYVEAIGFLAGLAAGREEKGDLPHLDEWKSTVAQLKVLSAELAAEKEKVRELVKRLEGNIGHKPSWCSKSMGSLCIHHSFLESYTTPK